MKKIINGKTYNTETAVAICGYEYGYGGDLDYIEECLYKTKKGAFFIWGEGGARSKYAVRSSYNSWGGGEDIIPVSAAEAKEFVENHGTADNYETAFGPAEEA